jgi:hypothetical protein
VYSLKRASPAVRYVVSWAMECIKQSADDESE